MIGRITVTVLVLLLAAITSITAGEPVDVGTHLQLLADTALVERLAGGARLELHRPAPDWQRQDGLDSSNLGDTTAHVGGCLLPAAPLFAN